MSRRLTQGEISLANDVFGGSIDMTRVKIHDGKFIFFQPNDSGMTPNGQIYVSGTYSADYAGEPPQRQAFFIHEMVHVWQHQTGVLAAGVIGSAIIEIIGRAGDYDSAYPYVLEEAKDLTEYGLEQQASIVEDYFRLTKLDLQPRRAVMPPARAWSERAGHARSHALRAGTGSVLDGPLLVQTSAASARSLGGEVATARAQNCEKNVQIAADANGGTVWPPANSHHVTGKP